jgi:plastocyanin
MKYTRTISLFAAFFIAGSVLFISGALAADGPYMGEKDLSVSSAETSMQKYEFLIIRTATPKVMEVAVGDTVTWRNYQRPKLPVVLVSDDDLWDDQTIYYGKIFTYTFEETGIYSFSAKDNPAITGTIVVTEKRMPSVSETPIKKDIMVPMPVPVMGEETGERISAMEKAQVQIREQAATRTNEFLIIRTATPEILEIYAGEAVTWKNYQRPKFSVVLVSDDGLWDDQTIYYGMIFTYTFEDTGIYSFSAKNNPAISGTVVVTEKRMPSVSETPIKKDIMVPMPVPIMGEDAGERVQTMDQVQEQREESIMARSNEFLIIRTVTPELIEIDAGEIVTWRNLQRPKFPVVLVSDDGLWDDQTIYYGKIFSYTFKESGVYAFSIENKPLVKITVVVK